MYEMELKLLGEVKKDVYYKWTTLVEFKAFDVMDIEVVQNGQKRIMQQGRIQIQIQGTCITDFQGMYKGSPFREKFRDIFEKVQNWDFAFKQWDPLYYALYDLQNRLKKIMTPQTQTTMF